MSGVLSNDPHLHTQRKQPNEGVVQQMKIKHSKDVIKPQDDRTPDVAIHKALALWHLGHENRVCHIILSETPLLQRKNTVVQTPHSTGCSIQHIWW